MQQPQTYLGRAGIMNRAIQNRESPVYGYPPMNVFGRRPGYGTGDIAPQLPPQGRTAFTGGLSPDEERWLNELRLANEAGALIQYPQINADARLQYHPIPEVTLGANATVTVEFIAGFTFSMDGLFVRSENALDLIVVDVQVARKSQFLAGGGVGASAFTEVATRGFKGDTVQQGQQISVTWRDVSGVARLVVGAALLGAVAR